MYRLILFASISLSSLVLPAQTWLLDTLSAMPEPVTNQAVCEGFIDDTAFVYSFGGLDSTKQHGGIHLKSWRYNTVTDHWEPLPDMPDSLGKIAAAASRVGDTIYVIGGYHVFPDGSEKSSNLVHRFDIRTNTWLSNGANIPVQIDDHVQSVWRDSLIYVVTGWSDVGNVPAVQIYDPAHDNWLEGTPTPFNSFYAVFGSQGYIFDDTIYYFGGAAYAQNFPIQGRMRRGIIEPDSPTVIRWGSRKLQNGLVGYRMAATRVFDDLHWLGGASVTYNYNPVAYNGSGPVSPSELNLYYDPEKRIHGTSVTPGLPMDLRGIAEASDTIKYIVGGIGPNQVVSDQTLRLRYQNLIGNSVEEELQSRVRVIWDGQSDTLMLSSESVPVSNLSVLVTDIQGREVAIRTSSPTGSVNMFGIPRGIYILTFESGGNAFLIKVQKY